MWLMSPISLEGTAQICTLQLLQGAWPGSRWVYFLHFQSTKCFRSMLRGSPSLQHRGCWGPQGSPDPKTTWASARGSSGRAEDALSTSSF